VTSAPATADGYWSLPINTEASIRHAAGLYSAEKPFDPHKPVELDGRPPELSALYANLDAKLPPMRIYTFSTEAEENQDFSLIPTTFLPGSPEDMIVSLIKRFEAGKAGYDSVWHGSKHPLPKSPTAMTICEVRDWQLRARKFQKSTAIGLYQIVGGTLRETIAKMGVDCDHLFDAKMQDRIGLALLYGRGWAEFKAGKMTVQDFAYELAGEWAAFPAPYGKHKGKSRHRGIAGNRHLIELPEYLAFLEGIRRKIDNGEAVSSEQQLDLIEPDGAVPLIEVKLERGDDSDPLASTTSNSETGPDHFEVVSLDAGAFEGSNLQNDRASPTIPRASILTFSN